MESLQQWWMVSSRNGSKSDGYISHLDQDRGEVLLYLNRVPGGVGYFEGLPTVT